jgi:hypothetical protein
VLNMRTANAGVREEAESRVRILGMSATVTRNSGTTRDLIRVIAKAPKATMSAGANRCFMMSNYM